MRIGQRQQEYGGSLMLPPGDLVGRIMRLFEGFSMAYGSYDAASSTEGRGGKMEIKTTARTVRAPVTRELWKSHVEGQNPLGIIPIRDNNTCLWGAIDVDQYDLVLGDVGENVAKSRLPLIPCRTKSGGVHLMLFLSEPAPASLVRARLQEMAVLLGYGGSEIFPKQSSVNLDRGDLGSWLNMPYFGGTKTERFAFRDTGLAMTLSEFLEVVEGLKQPLAFLEIAQRKKPEKDPSFGDGPPCLQHIASVGLPEGGRNKGLFAMGVFAKKKFGLKWAAVLEEWNRTYVSPPLPAEEIVGIIKQLEKKEYNYTCRDFPLAQYCNSALCRTRRFGVGGEDEYPVLGNLRVLGTDPPVWFLEVGDSQLELNTDQLMQYRLFQKACAERLHVCYRGMKSDDWMKAIGVAMRDVVQLDAPPELSSVGEFQELLEDFCTNRHRGERQADLMLGRPWDNPEQNRIYFRLRDLQKFLDLQNFRDYSRTQIGTRIRDLGGDRVFFNIQGRGVHAWWVPRDLFDTGRLDIPTPPIEEEPI